MLRNWRKCHTALQYLALASLAGKLLSTASSTSSQLSGLSASASSPALRTWTGASLGPGFLPFFMAAALSDLDLVMAVTPVLKGEHGRGHSGCTLSPLRSSGKE